MPDSWPIALAIIVAVVAAWDWARKDLALAHGRMLSADRSQTFERAITTLDLSQKSIATHMQDQAERIAKAEAAVNQLAITKATAARVEELASHVGTLALNTKIDVDGLLTARDGLADWQKTCERSIELLQADIDKRDKAITNVAEEVAGLQRQQALALMGIAKTPKHGYAPGGPK